MWWQKLARNSASSVRKINRVFETTSFKRVSSDTQSQFKIQRAKGFKRIFFVAPDCILVEVLQVL